MKATLYKGYLLLIIAFFILPGGCCGPQVRLEAANSPENPNSPISNFCVVEPDILWRGAGLDPEGITWLINNNVGSIINLEWLCDDQKTIGQANPADWVSNRRLDYYRVKTWEPLYAFARSPADEDVVHFLAVVRQARRPVYVHCRAGENRTGVMVAAYRIILQGMTGPAEVAEVIEEMQSYKGFWSDAIAEYIHRLWRNREEIRERVRAYDVEEPLSILCDNGRCRPDSGEKRQLHEPSPKEASGCSR